jgi:predicted acyl esterase
MGLHLRGNTEAFTRAATPHKKMRIHLGSHVHPFYTEYGRLDQIRFFDYWLKGIDNGVMTEPPVKLAIRKGADIFECHEHEWPLARTRWTKFYFDLSQPAAEGSAMTGRLDLTKPAKPGSRSYAASSLGSMGSTSAASSQVLGGGIKLGMGLAVETAPLAADTEITGPLAAVLWVSSSSEDMDLTLRNIAPDGSEIMETGQQGLPVPVAKGWLRVSHRELDPDLSLPYRPYHRHVRRLYLNSRGNRARRGGNLADIHGVQERPPHSAGHSAARRRRQRALHALSRRLQQRYQYGLCRRQDGFSSAAADHSSELLMALRW